MYEEQYKSLFDAMNPQLHKDFKLNRFEELHSYVICIGEGLRARVSDWLENEERHGIKMISLVKGDIKTFISVDSPELFDLLVLKGYDSALIFVNTVEESERLMKLAQEDVKSCASHVFIAAFHEEYEAKCEAAKKSGLVSHHQVIPMDNNKVMTKVLSSVLLPPRIEFLDLSLREPVMHERSKFPVKNKAKILEILYSELKPRYIVTQAYYRKQKVQDWQRRCIASVDDELEEAICSKVRQWHDLFKANPHKQPAESMYKDYDQYCPDQNKVKLE